MPAASKLGCPFYWSRMQFCSLGSVINCFVLCILGCSAAYWPANNNISSTTKNVFIRCQMSLGVEAELLGLGTKARIVVSGIYRLEKEKMLDAATEFPGQVCWAFCCCYK